MNGIGEKIRIRRLMKNYSQEYMAFVLEISQAAYSNLERDGTEMTVQRIFDIAEIFQMSPYELMPKPKFGSNINYLMLLLLARKISNYFFPEKARGKSLAPIL